MRKLTQRFPLFAFALITSLAVFGCEDKKEGEGGEGGGAAAAGDTSPAAVCKKTGNMGAPDEATCVKSAEMMKKNMGDKWDGFAKCVTSSDGSKEAGMKCIKDAGIKMPGAGGPAPTTPPPTPPTGGADAAGGGAAPPAGGADAAGGGAAPAGGADAAGGGE